MSTIKATKHHDVVEAIVEVNYRSAKAAKHYNIMEIGTLSDLIPLSQAEELRKEFLRHQTPIRQLTNIANVSAYASQPTAEENHSIRLIDRRDYDIAEEVLIFDDTVAIYRLEPSPLYAEFTDKMYAKTMRKMFATFWARGKQTSTAPQEEVIDLTSQTPSPISGYKDTFNISLTADNKKSISFANYNVSNFLPPHWADQFLETANAHTQKVTLLPPSVTSREDPEVKALAVSGIPQADFLPHVPWFESFYTGLFCDLANTFTRELVSPATIDRHKYYVSTQQGNIARYEAHIDSNPVQAMLYVTTHEPGTGGELVISRNTLAHSVEEIEDSDPIMIYPEQGKLIFFDARKHPHYVRPLKDSDATRVAIGMNYYTPSCPESSRPTDLDDYLAGKRVH